MGPRDYRESWAWVHLLLASDGPGKAVLLDYLSETRTGKRSRTLSQILTARGISGKNLVAHLERVQNSVLARTAEPPSGERLIRFQDPPAERPDVQPPPPARVSLLKRIGSWLGF